MQFTKGHGTGNDFVIIPDPQGRLTLTPELVAGLCDRRFGLGADGVLRVVRSAGHPEAARYADEAEWFMDYRNADGSLAEMCGNGARVFVRYLLTHGLAAEPAPPVATRAGVVRTRVDGDGVCVQMSRPRVYGGSTAEVGGRRLAGSAVDVGNPHLVCPLPAGIALADLDLTRPPGFDPVLFAAGVNVEFVEPAEGSAGVPEGSAGVPDGAGGAPADPHVRMRVHERGSAETLSCGTGACAVAAVVLRQAGRDTGTVTVDVPGGRLVVTVEETSCWLSGPAVLVASGEIDTAALASHRA
ncbi:diaminopimelate epimerase [Plantactinospora sp. KBS50]|uniref:diaminopimelate epimerase n=1 Tax=Plantactinospora sp. KBS50 TaxID=2024580 RepID=UPI000BAB0F43|nr:diaminopimelate epimerase [Plantactinospora sp. KBS50]ASW54138.1 diaminopimelate epimerase [Plantactinospora sp. KBS50]